MEMKQDFIKLLDALMAASPEIVEKYGTEPALAYIKALREDVKEQTKLTKKGAMILRFMQDSDSLAFKAKDIADSIGVPSRSISGALQKLVNDGYVEKIGSAPVIYSITDEGKNFNIEGENV